MAPDRPSSPTSLLWAHQIRREHQYLLSRMKKLESASEIHSDRIKSAETAAKAFATGEVASLTAKISALETSGKSQQQHVVKLEKDLNERLDDTQAETEALALQVASLVDRDAEAKEETKLVLQGIEEAKAGLKNYENSLKALGKVVVPREIRRVEERLEMLSREIGGQAGDLKVCREDVQRLGEVNEVLRKGCETLEGQVRRVAERGPVVGEVKEERAKKKRRISAVQDQPTQNEIRSSCDENGPTEPKKKTHKYTGGGADKDIIQQGAMVSLGTRSAAKAISSISPSSTVPVASRKTAVPKRISGPKKESPRRRIPAPVKIANKTASVTDTSSTASRSRKTHKWAGGGAERDMIASGLNSNLGRRRSRSSDNVEHESAMKTPRMTVDGKKIVRSGKGWVEFEEPLEDDDGQTGDAEASFSRGKGSRPIITQPASNASESTKSRQPHHGLRLPTLRDDERELIVSGSRTRQTKTQKQTQDVMIKADHSEDKGTAPRKLKPQPVFGSVPYTTRQPADRQERRTVPQSVEL